MTTRAHVAAQLAQPAKQDPPTFLATAAEFGWTEAAARVNRWSANGWQGHWTDPQYAPKPTTGGAL